MFAYSPHIGTTKRSTAYKSLGKNAKLGLRIDTLNSKRAKYGSVSSKSLVGHQFNMSMQDSHSYLKPATVMSITKMSIIDHFARISSHSRN